MPSPVDGAVTLDAPSGRAGLAALRRQNDSLRQAIAVVDRLSAAALEGADVAGLSLELARAIGRDVAVFDARLRLLATAPGDGDRGTARAIADPRVAGVLEAARERRLPLRVRALPGWGLRSDVVIAPIAVGEETLGYLLATTGGAGRDDEDLELLTLQHAASLYALAFVESERDAQVRAQYRAGVIESLLLGRPDQASAAELARLVGLGQDGESVVFAIAPQDDAASAAPPTRAGLLESIVADLDDFEPGVAALARADHAVVIAPERLGSGEAGAVIADLLRLRFPAVGFSLGASAPILDPVELGPAEEQARRALGVARRLGIVGEVTSHEHLGVHRLFHYVPASELRGFAEDVLGELAAHDAAHRAALVETLAAYLRVNGNLRRAGEELFVHVNTVAYRVRRVEEITGLDLANSEDRLLAQLAIEALRTLPVGITAEAREFQELDR